MVIGIVIWVVLLGAWAGRWFLTRVRTSDAAARSPQQIWDDTDPAYRGGMSGIGPVGFTGGTDFGGSCAGDGGGGWGGGGDSGGGGGDGGGGCS